VGPANLCGDQSFDAVGYGSHRLVLEFVQRLLKEVGDFATQNKLGNVNQVPRLVIG
jgi:hypothetical protein